MKERRRHEEAAAEQAQRLGLAWPPPEHKPAAPPPELYKTHRSDRKPRPNPWDRGRVKHRARQQSRLADAYGRAGLVELGEDVRRCGSPKALALVAREVEQEPGLVPLGVALAELDHAQQRRDELERACEALHLPEEERERRRELLEEELRQLATPLPPREAPPTWPPELGEPPRELLDELDRRGLMLVMSRRAADGGAPRALMYTCGQRHCVEGCGAQHAAHGRGRVLDRVHALAPDTDDEGNVLAPLGDLLGALEVYRPGCAPDRYVPPALPPARRRRIEAHRAAARELLEAPASAWCSPPRWRVQVGEGARVELAARATWTDPTLEHLAKAAWLEGDARTLREAERLVEERTGLRPRQRKPSYLLETALLESAAERDWHNERRKRGRKGAPDAAEAAQLEATLQELRAGRGKLYRGEVRCAHHAPMVWRWTRLHLRDEDAGLWTFTRADLAGEPCALGIWHLQRALALFFDDEEVRRRTYAHVLNTEPEWSSPATRQRRVTMLHEEANALELEARELLEVWDHEGADKARALAARRREEAHELSTRNAMNFASWWHTHAHAVVWLHGGFCAHHRLLAIWRRCIRAAYLEGAELLRARAGWLLGVGLSVDNRGAVSDAATVESIAARRAERLRLLARREARRTKGAERWKVWRHRALARALANMAHEVEAVADEQARELLEGIEAETTKAQRRDAAGALLSLAEQWREQAERDGAGGLNIRPRKRGERVEARIAEAVKYATKTMGSRHTEIPLEALADLVAATRGKRLMKCGGLLYGVQLEEEGEPAVQLEGGPVEVTELAGERLEVWGYAPDGSKVFEDEVVWLDGTDPLAQAVRVEALRQGWELAAARRREELQHRRGPAPPRRRRG